MISEAYFLAASVFKSELQRLGFANMAENPDITRVAITSQTGGEWALECHAKKGQTIDDLEAFHVRLWWNGFPAGVLEPSGGFMATGRIANENQLIADLKAVEAQ